MKIFKNLLLQDEANAQYFTVTVYCTDDRNSVHSLTFVDRCLTETQKKAHIVNSINRAIAKNYNAYLFDIEESTEEEIKRYLNID